MIRGEKVFTRRVRQDFVAKCVRTAELLEADAKRFREFGVELSEVETTEDLEALRLETPYVSDRYERIDVLPYCIDMRTKCHYCKKMEWGGCSGLMLSDRERFCCWRSTCNTKYDRDLRKDKKAHPKRYALEKRRSAARRSKEIRWGRRRLNKKRKPNRSRTR